MECLEIGPGDGPAKAEPGEVWSWLNADPSNPRTGTNYLARWGYQRLPIEDNTFGLVYASHVIEHVPWNRTDQALAEAYRILSPGGTLELWTVDFRQVVMAYLQNKIPDQWRRDNPDNDYMYWVNGRIFSYDQQEGQELNLHRACFDGPSLSKHLLRAGFRGTYRLQHPRGADHGVINLGMGAVK